jgi:hypothetical protein
MHNYNEDLIDQLHAMRVKDKHKQDTRCHNNYFTDEVDEDCRKKMVSWCFTVVDSFNLSRESVWRAMDLLDRYLSSGKGLSSKALENKQSFQLACTVCLYVAVKVYENVEMTIGFLVKLCRNYYTASEVINMEHDILFALNWSVAVSTPLDFVRLCLQLESDLIDEPATIDRILEEAQKQMDLATSDVYFASSKNSSIGLACLGAALEESGVSPALQEQFWLHLSSLLDFDIASREVRDVERHLLLGSTIVCNNTKRQSSHVLSKPSLKESDQGNTSDSREQSSPISIWNWTQQSI